MKMTQYSAALAALYSQDPKGTEQSFQHLTPPVLSTLDAQLAAAAEDDGTIISLDHSVVLAKAVIRRIVHQCLDKYSRVSSSETMEEALEYHLLPENVQSELKQRYGCPTRTWFESLEHLQEGTSNKNELWKKILDHPMTSYVPMQCQSCGHVIPDNSDGRDDEVGISEEEPTGEELELRAGWFRGPRRAVVFVLRCPNCQSCSRWYRSGHPKIMLNPSRWGRLCGEQEDLRLKLATYLGISLRTCLPLDWDHVWSEFRDEEEDADDQWLLPDENARNFAARLDEGIGYWTGVWAIHPDPSMCEDVTEKYLRCQQRGGHADDSLDNDMERYRQLVQSCLQCSDGVATTQAKSVNGHVLQRANFTSLTITKELQQAAEDFGVHPWWEVK
mmetsp:Transcript_26122/g.38644  ORF Transcript_26122/g.38644 Transcript_26122/m.38644 type:complete len:388 (-) Transcript_26122:11-1174(-)